MYFEWKTKSLDQKNDEKDILFLLFFNAKFKPSDGIEKQRSKDGKNDKNKCLTKDLKNGTNIAEKNIFSRSLGLKFTQF